MDISLFFILSFFEDDDIKEASWSVLRIRIRMDPHNFGKLDPNPHHSGKLDPDLNPHQSEKVEALEGYLKH